MNVKTFNTQKFRIVYEQRKDNLIGLD